MGHIYNVLAKTGINKEPTFYPHRLVVEQCENIHIHMRNLRLEFDDKEYVTFCNTMSNSVEKYYETTVVEIKEIPIEEIQAFDNSHKAKDGYFDCGAKQEEHVEGIKFIKDVLSIDKYEILPIAVYKVMERYADDAAYQYKRLDGFKRFWAMKEAGAKTIKCAVMKHNTPGVQRGLHPVIKKGSK